MQFCHNHPFKALFAHHLTIKVSKYMSNQMLLSLMVVDVITWVIDVLVSVGVMVVVSVDGVSVV
ncbi:hypothetical protein RIR_e36165_A0A2I1F918_9GLOM [Rhizophagus irregularis DAOM 181602=DAOM 197198]|nr:hypothetical protein RIR_e36165_A0A2I1F918_9GLOM [Rhizophagus irregularis DAOM 181602=DAOM 197198]